MCSFDRHVSHWYIFNEWYTTLSATVSSHPITCSPSRNTKSQHSDKHSQANQSFHVLDITPVQTELDDHFLKVNVIKTTKKS